MNQPDYHSLRTVTVNRYILPLREGGSLPALADADDGFKYVVKFKGAGHGTKALIAEYLGGEIARKLGMKVPELVFAQLHEAFGRTEADEEIQDLIDRVNTTLRPKITEGEETFLQIFSRNEFLNSIVEASMDSLKFNGL
jgi:hypothetical protein